MLSPWGEVEPDRWAVAPGHLLVRRRDADLTPGTDATAVLDGFTISGGNADGLAFPDNAGGGVFNLGGRAMFRNCRLQNNQAALVGGGAYFSGRRTIPRWQSTLIVQINSPKQVFARLDDIDVDELALRTDPILSEALVLTTHGLALDVVRAVNLQIDILDRSIFRGAVMTGIDIDSAGAPPGRYQLQLDADGFNNAIDVVRGQRLLHYR